MSSFSLNADLLGGIEKVDGNFDFRHRGVLGRRLLWFCHLLLPAECCTTDFNLVCCPRALLLLYHHYFSCAMCSLASLVRKSSFGHPIRRKRATSKKSCLSVGTTRYDAFCS